MSNKVKIPRTPVVQEPVQEESPAVQVKRVLLSKTIWVNLLALLALFVEKRYGFLIDPELQMQILTLINIALRFVTHEKIVWGGEKRNTPE